VKRPALLLGLLTVDALVVIFLCLPTLALGLIVYGVDFKTGPLGIVVFVLLAAFWGICLAGFVYALALKFPSPGLERVSALIFQPLIYIAPAFVPKNNLSGWLKAAATFNPLTYVLEGMRSLIFTGWDSTVILKAVAASAAVGVVSFTLAMVALQRRLTRTTGG
jgi:ABC-2 type transport system permease protein